MEILPKIRAQWNGLRAFLRSENFRELILWCLPALVIGGVLRLLLIVHFPYGYIQGDTMDFLLTTERLLQHHDLVLHSKKAFLSPILYTLPFLLKIPALLIIPVAQHLCGLIFTVLAGALVRLWFAHWKWFIIPATVLLTVNPALLWYEHAILAECHYLFCVTALALAGTLFALRPSAARMFWLIVALLFTAGSRPEGKLFVAFGILLVALVPWGNRRQWLQHMAIILVASGLIWKSSRNGQAGVLLYATVLPLAPEVSKAEPDFSPVIAPLRAKYIEQGATVRTKLTTAEKKISGLADSYLRSKGKHNADINALCQKLAVEAALHQPWLLPALAANKFLMSCNSPTSPDYGEHSLHEKQVVALLHRPWVYEIMKGFTGHDLRTQEEATAFIQEKYVPLHPDWFSKLQHVWGQATLAHPGESRHYGKMRLPATSYLFLAAMLGMVGALLRPGPLLRFHWPWLLAFSGVWFVVMLTGVVNPRYRFVFEPFCVIYALLLFDLIWSGVEAVARLTRKSSPTVTA